MPLYMCSMCFSVENTSLGGYWRQQMDAIEAEKKLEAKCSACNPAIGQWHGSFPRRSADGYLITKDGFLHSISEVDELTKRGSPFERVIMPKDTPHVIRQTPQPMTDDHAKAWFDEQVKEARALGVTFPRFAHHPDRPGIYLFEGWKVRPEDQGEPRFSPAVVLQHSGGEK